VISDKSLSQKTRLLAEKTCLDATCKTSTRKTLSLWARYYFLCKHKPQRFSQGSLI